MDNEKLELSEGDREELARQIREGNTSGRIDGEEPEFWCEKEHGSYGEIAECEDCQKHNGEGFNYSIAWELKVDKFKS